MNARGMCRLKAAGFSLVEMVMTLAIGLILAAITLPTLVGAIQGYRLSSTAQQAASLIELARYTAIRRNSLMSVQQTVQNGNTVLFIDLNGNGTLDPNEPLMMLPSDMQIANGQPFTPPAVTTGLNPTQDFSTPMWFDYRGTVNYATGIAPATYFLALGFTNQAQYGCRAVTVSPMGQTKMWKAPAGGGWTGM